MKAVYRIANHTVEIDSLFPAVHEMCMAYAADGPAEIRVETARADIAREQAASEEEARAEGLPVRRYADAYLETLAVYRKLAEHLLERGVLLFHGSAIAVDGRAYLFTARSGTGKSTHARLWRELLGERAAMVNDDKPLLEISGGRVTAFGTPWDGKHHLSSNIAAPLEAVCLLERGAENSIAPITVAEAWPMLLQQSFRPASPEGLIRAVALADALAHNVRLYRLRCNLSPDAARVAYEGMNKGANL